MGWRELREVGGGGSSQVGPGTKGGSRKGRRGGNGSTKTSRLRWALGSQDKWITTLWMMTQDPTECFDFSQIIVNELL